MEVSSLPCHFGAGERSPPTPHPTPGETLMNSEKLHRRAGQLSRVKLAASLQGQTPQREEQAGLCFPGKTKPAEHKSEIVREDTPLVAGTRTSSREEWGLLKNIRRQSVAAGCRGRGWFLALSAW